MLRGSFDYIVPFVMFFTDAFRLVPCPLDPLPFDVVDFLLPV